MKLGIYIMPFEANLNGISLISNTNTVASQTVAVITLLLLEF
jgi:hypothetical protein